MDRKKLGMLFGAQYYRPPFPERACWRRDMENMRALGFNTVKLWAVWNDVEREPGRFTFDELDALMNLAGEYGLRVVINLIPEGAPYWTRAGNEDAYYQTASGERVTYGGPANLPTAGWPGLCIDKEEAANLVLRFIRETSAHVAGHSALLAIDVWNEPHLEPMFDYRGDMLCYCGHSAERFREWLQKKYGTVDALNAAWFRRYRDWCEALPPPRLGTGVDMMDWRLFWLENMRRWMRMRVTAAREGAPETWIQSHVAYSGYVGASGRGGLANELGDEFLLSREVDVFGLTCFPKWLMRDDPLFNHMINNEIVAAASREKPFYQVELQGGGGKAGYLGGEVPTGDDVRLWNYLTVAAGGKGVTYWQYAPEPAGMESPGFGLTGFLGENTERSLAAGRCAKELNTPAMAGARRVIAQNAIYLSRTASLWFYAAGREEERYARAIHGLYRLAYENGVPVTFAHQDDAATLYEDGIRTLLLPSPMTFSAAEMDALEAFAAKGGTIVSEACPGLYDGHGVLERQGSALKRLFGLSHIEVQALESGKTVVARQDGQEVFRGAEYRQAVRPCEQVAICASFEDGAPALTERRLGEGRAVWLGAFVFAAYAGQRHAETERLLLSFLRLNGYPQIDELKITRGKERAAVVARLLETDGGYHMALVNPTGENARVRVVPSEGLGSEVTVDLEGFACEIVAL